VLANIAMNRIENPAIRNAKAKCTGETKPITNTTKKIHWRPLVGKLLFHVFRHTATTLLCIVLW